MSWLKNKLDGYTHGRPALPPPEKVTQCDFKPEDIGTQIKWATVSTVNFKENEDGNIRK